MAPTRRELLGTATAAAAAGCLGAAPPAATRECPPATGTEADVRVGFGGDVMLGRSVDERWSGGPPAGVWGSLHDRLAALDGLVVNLECCVSDRGSRRPGRGYYFRADPDWAVPALEAGGAAFASLANNHVLDFGPAALADTTDHLSGAGVAHAGAGADRRAATEPAVATAGDLTVGVVALTDQAPSYRAGPVAPGTAHAELDTRNRWTRRLVGRALGTLRRADPDLVVASLHWGPNWVPRPSAAQRRFARWLVDRGVDVVHGHSAHVIQGIEVRRGRPIIYDAGDLVDDYAVKPELHNDRSFLFELVVEDGVVEALDLVPVEIADEAVGRAGDEAAGWLRERMRSLSAEFGTTFRRRGDGLRIDLSGC